MLAAQEDAGEVVIHDLSPAIDLDVERGAVARAHATHVVVDHVEATVAVHDLGIHRDDLSFIGQVRLDALSSDSMSLSVNADDNRTFAFQPGCNRCPDFAGRTVDDANLVGEPLTLHVISSLIRANVATSDEQVPNQSL
jgi:hypothetical protein